MLPAVKPAKSASSQPLVTGSRGSVRSTSTASTGAVASPLAEYDIVANSSSSTYSRVVGAVRSNAGSPTSLNSTKSNTWVVGE